MKNSPTQKIILDAVASYATASKLALAGSIVGFGIVGVNPAQAASLNNGTGISTPATTITFSEFPLADDTALTNQYSSLGVTFSGLWLDTTINSGFPNITLPAARNFTTDTNTNPFLVSFTQSQSQAAFSLITVPGTSTFEALLNNSVVDTFSAATNLNSSNNFYGFTGVTFDTIRVTAGGNDRAVIDNIQFSPAAAQSVPEPFSIIGTLVGGTAAFRIRKKLADANKA